MSGLWKRNHHYNMRYLSLKWQWLWKQIINIIIGHNMSHQVCFNISDTASNYQIIVTTIVEIECDWKTSIIDQHCLVYISLLTVPRQFWRELPSQFWRELWSWFGRESRIWVPLGEASGGAGSPCTGGTRGWSASRRGTSAGRGC